MKLYYKVPFYDNSDFMGHLIEHCIIHPDKNNINQCGLAPRIGGSLSWEKTRIEFDHLEDKQIIFDMIHRPITQEIVDYEYRIFNEEFWSIGYISRLLEKCNKLFLGDDRSKKPRPFTLEEIQTYHQHHIVNGNYILMDEDTNQIVEHNFDEDTLIPLDRYTKPALEYHLVYLEGQKNLIIAHRWSDVNALVYFFCIYDIIKSWDSYTKRYQLDSYYTYSPSDYYTTGLCWIRISPHCSLDITQEYFEFQKNYFLRELRTNGYPSIIISSMLFNNQLYELEKSLDLINSISYDEFIDIIQNIKNIS